MVWFRKIQQPQITERLIRRGATTMHQHAGAEDGGCVAHARPRPRSWSGHDVPFLLLLLSIYFIM